MVISRNSMVLETREKVRDGQGTAAFTHFVEGKGAVQKNTNLLAEITLPQGASIGYHQHIDETEFYLILEGTGTVNDNGKEKPIQPGDAMITGNGAFHSIANTGGIPLKMIAAIIKG